MGLVPVLPAGPVSTVPKSVTSWEKIICTLLVVVCPTSAWVSVKLALVLSAVAKIMYCRSGGWVALANGSTGAGNSLEMASPLLSVVVVSSNVGNPPGGKGATCCQLTVLFWMGLPLASVTLTTMG